MDDGTLLLHKEFEAELTLLVLIRPIGFVIDKSPGKAA